MCVPGGLGGSERVPEGRVCRGVGLPTERAATGQCAVGAGVQGLSLLPSIMAHILPQPSRPSASIRTQAQEAQRVEREARERLRSEHGELLRRLASTQQGGLAGPGPGPFAGEQHPSPGPGPSGREQHPSHGLVSGSDGGGSDHPLDLDGSFHRRLDGSFHRRLGLEDGHGQGWPVQGPPFVPNPPPGGAASAPPARVQLPWPADELAGPAHEGHAGPPPHAGAHLHPPSGGYSHARPDQPYRALQRQPDDPYRTAQQQYSDHGSGSQTRQHAALQPQPPQPQPAPRRPSMIVCESRPLCEGVTLAKRLAAMGIDVTLVTDAQVRGRGWACFRFFREAHIAMGMHALCMSRRSPGGGALGRLP